MKWISIVLDSSVSVTPLLELKANCVKQVIVSYKHFSFLLLITASKYFMIQAPGFENEDTWKSFFKLSQFWILIIVKKINILNINAP
jgi:hypothetical protein